MTTDSTAAMTRLERLFALRASVTAAIESELARTRTIGLPPDRPGVIDRVPDLDPEEAA